MEPPAITSEYLKTCLAQWPSGMTDAAFQLWGWVVLSTYTGLHCEGGFEPTARLYSVHGGAPDPAEVRPLLDDAFCRHFVRVVPAMVKRLLAFEPLSVKKSPAEPVFLYFEQAMVCYVMGLHDAAVALSRACLEHALKTTLPDASPKHELKDLLHWAGLTRHLAGPTLRMARDVQRVANRALHRQQCSPADAATVVAAMRGVMRDIYEEAKV